MAPVGDDHRKLRVLVVDDHPLVREGLKSVIDGQRDMEAVAVAAEGIDALRLAQELAPDIMLIDVSMPGWDGVTMTENIKGRVRR